MFKLLRRKPSHISLQKIVADIHNEFDAASDKILNDAKDLIESEDAIKLKQLGFHKAAPVVNNLELKQKKLLADKVCYFRQHYPFNKFISEDMVKSICEKYGLVFGGVRYYKGQIPNKNVMEMSRFKLKEQDYSKETYHQYDEYVSPILDQFSNSIIRPATAASYKYQSEFAICAPEKDFDMTYLKKVGHKLELPDPIVLQPVEGGYLIISKWGLEASDELLVNEKDN